MKFPILVMVRFIFGSFYTAFCSSAAQVWIKTEGGGGVIRGEAYWRGQAARVIGGIRKRGGGRDRMRTTR